MNETGEIVGMVDVLKLTYATLEQVSLVLSAIFTLLLTAVEINTMSTGDGEGPAWGKFWLSLDNDSESMVSGDGSHRHTAGHRSLLSPDISSRTPLDRVDSVQPNESASHNGDDSHSDNQDIPSSTLEDAPFPFKFKAPSGRVHRLQVVASAGMAELISNVTAKLGGEVDAVGGEATFEDGRLGDLGYALSYLDNEGDTVSITTDRDLLDAIMLSRQNHRDKVDLFVHDPEKPPLSVTLDPQPALSRPLTPPPSTLRERRRAHEEEEEEEEEDEMATPIKREQRKPAASQPKQQEQIIAGISNDLLLPGAIVTLAVVIIGVFTLSRSNR